MNHQIIKRYLKLGIFALFMGNLFWTGTSTILADDLTVNDRPSLEIFKKQALATKAAAKKRAEEAALATNMVSEVTVEYTSNTYPAGQCTWGAKEMAPWVGNYWGNAGDWTTSAASLGYEVGTIPKVGAITVWTDENGGYGHVAYVTDVATDGQIQVTESNYNGSYYPSNIRGFFDPTKTSEGKVSYIYPPAGV
ncbi:CHAP domain-containing protein [Streptococcus parasuis]|uniref:CHAP domain-containing protein n=1 Tax=Streptococcus parasuis TaxID=1501662 RepID=UPI0028B24D4B|nr:CHAP domain-containing protein [Streptococcus parasuis]